MIKKISHILTGWGKRLGILSVSTAEQKLADLRSKQCKACPYSKESKVLRLLKGAAHYDQVLKCCKCGCPIAEKTIVVDEKCPIEKW